MIKFFFVAIALTIFGQTIAQKADFQNDTNQEYNDALRENLEKLGVNWPLPPSAQALMNSGLNLLVNGEWKPALDFFTQVIDLDSTFIPARYFRYSCYYIGNKSSNKQAYKDFDYVRDHVNPSFQKTYMRLWNIYIPNKFHPSRTNSTTQIFPPLLLLSDYLLQHRSSVKAESFEYLRQSASAILAGRPHDAFRINNQAQNIESTSCGLYLKALTFHLNAQLDSAFYFYSELIRIDNRVIEAHQELAFFKQLINDNDGALQHLNYLNSLELNSPYLWRYCGMMRFQLEDYHGAIQDLTKYLQVEPNDFDCLKKRAIAAYEVKDYNSSLKDLIRAEEIFDKDLDIFLYQSENYLHIGDSIMCIKILQNATKTFSFNQQLDLFTANKLVEVNKIRKAQQIIDRVSAIVLLNNFNKEYLYQARVIQCKIYLKSGDTQRALDALNSFINKDGEQMDYLFLRANIFLVLGEKDKAKSDLEKLVKQTDFKPARTLYNSL
jgi:tetratricopeptide (TPR) repeat protein